MNSGIYTKPTTNDYQCNGGNSEICYPPIFHSNPKENFSDTKKMLELWSLQDGITMATNVSERVWLSLHNPSGQGSQV